MHVPFFLYSVPLLALAALWVNFLWEVAPQPSSVLRTFLALVAAWAAILVAQARRPNAFHDDLARELGLSRVPRPWLYWSRFTVVEGLREGFSVRVEQVSVNKGPDSFEITIDGRQRPGASIPRDVRVGRAAVRFLPRSLRAEDLQLGDPVIDDAMDLRGRPAVLIALFTAEVRVLFKKVLAAAMGLGVEQGVVRAAFPVAPQALAREALLHTLELAGRLATGEEAVPATLAGIARGERSDVNRARSLEALAESYPGHPETAEALRAGLRDPATRVRCAAAKLSGEEGFPVLADLVSSRVTVSATALGHLVAHFPAERVRPLVRAALVGGHEPARVAALKALAVAGDAALEDRVVASLAAEHEEERLAAIRALAACGTAAAVAPLRALAGRSGALELALRRSIEDAIATIQARLTDAAAGQVSLAGGGDAAAGRLGIAGAGGQGRLALPES
jgi:hypothetical protein